MDVSDVLVEAYGRIPSLVEAAVEGLDAEALATPPAPGANTVGWLVWHLTRVQDHHLAEILGEDQVWAGDGWAARFDLHPDPSDTGYGHSDDQVRAVRPDGPAACTDYLAAVWSRTEGFLRGIAADDLDRVVDEGWDPPVTLGVRLISVVDDSVQHAGQAAFVRGLLD